MSTASVLIAADQSMPEVAGKTGEAALGPRYTLLLSNDSADIDAVQRLRYDVFSSEPGFQLASTPEAFEGRDADRFDEHCDHLLVREDVSGDVVGCYRMLPPPGAIAAGGLYSATEFDISGLDSLRPQLVEMGRAVVRGDHRNGAVVLLMWAGILAYLDRCDYTYVTGCVSVPMQDSPEQVPGSQVRAVRDFVMKRHAAAPQYTVRPYNPVVVGGMGLDDIAPPAKVQVPALMRGYLRLGAKVLGEPAHDPDFGVADFMALLNKNEADVRYLKRLRSVGAASEIGATTVPSESE